MNLKKLLADAAKIREDLTAVRKALEERHCPPDCKCRANTLSYYFPNTTSVTSGATYSLPLNWNNTAGGNYTSGGNWTGT